MHLNLPETIPLPLVHGKKCDPRNQSLVPKRLGTPGLKARQELTSVCISGLYLTPLFPVSLL